MTMKLSSFEPLSDAERNLIEWAHTDKAAKGSDADALGAMVGYPNAENVRGEFLRWLLTSNNDQESVHIAPTGLRLHGGLISGILNLEDCSVAIPLVLVNVRFEQEIVLRRAKMKMLWIESSKLTGLDGQDVTVDGPVILQKCRIDGTVCFQGATINGNLHCHGSKLDAKGGVALICGGAEVRGSVHLNKGFAAHGEVNFVGAQIQGALECQGASVRVSPGQTALQCSRLRLGSTAFLRDGFSSEGSVNFVGATIDGSLEFDAAKLNNGTGSSLNLGSARISGSVHLRRQFESVGQVNLEGVSIGGALDCRGGKFANPKGRSLLCVRASIATDVNCSGEFVAVGEVTLNRARIGGSFMCDGGKFSNPGLTAIDASGATIEENAFLRDGFTADGQVDFAAAQIRRLECDGGKFNGAPVSLRCNGTVVAEAVFLRRGFSSIGCVDLTASALGALDLSGGTFRKGTALVGLKLRRAKIRTAIKFVDRDPQSRTPAQPILQADAIDLSGCQAEALVDGAEVWPFISEMTLDGFRFERIEDSPTSSRERLNWLYRQPKAHLAEEFRPQPWQHLAGVLRASGHVEDAQEIAIEKRKRQPTSTRGVTRALDKLLSGFLLHTCGYGYRPWTAIAWCIYTVIAFWLVYAAAADNGLFVPAGTVEQKLVLESPSIPEKGSSASAVNAAQAFDGLLYSADVFLPIVDAQAEQIWKPGRDAASPGTAPIYVVLLRYAILVEALLGVILTSLAIASFAGWLRAD